MIWYPYAQMKTLDPPIKLSRAEGVHLYTEDGLDLIDSVSSWWSVIHGYNHPEMNAAISGQLEKFAHVMLGGITHEPVQRLSAKLEDITRMTRYTTCEGKVGFKIEAKGKTFTLRVKPAGRELGGTQPKPGPARSREAAHLSNRGGTPHEEHS